MQKFPLSTGVSEYLHLTQGVIIFMEFDIYAAQ